MTLKNISNRESRFGEFFSHQKQKHIEFPDVDMARVSKITAGGVLKRNLAAQGLLLWPLWLEKNMAKSKGKGHSGIIMQTRAVRNGQLSRDNVS